MPDRRKRVHNQRFSHMCLARILATPGHLLSFLVDEQKGKWRGTRHGSETPAIQIGHAESLHAGGAEGLFLEDADFNQMSNWKGERQGAIFQKSGVLIGGIPVERRTAQMWEAVGELPPGTVAGAPISRGWIPA